MKPKPGARKAKKQLFCIRRWSIPSGPLQAPLRLVLETLRMGDCRRQTLARQSRNLFIIPFPRRNILPTDTYLGNLFITLARSLASVLHPRPVQPPRTGVNPPPSLRKRLRPPLDLEPLSTGTSQPAAISRLYSGGSNLSRLPAAAKQRLLDFWQQRLSVWNQTIRHPSAKSRPEFKAESDIHIHLRAPSILCWRCGNHHP